MKKYVCEVCGYVYDPAVGDPDNSFDIAYGNCAGCCCRRTYLDDCSRKVAQRRKGRKKKAGRIKGILKFSFTCFNLTNG